jgi:hypothetical protein
MTIEARAFALQCAIANRPGAQVLDLLIAALKAEYERGKNEDQ